MQIAAWVWQLSQDYPGAEPDDSKLPIDQMWVKAADGMWPQGHFDSHPAEISGLAAARELRDIYHRQGINMIPWVVPHGTYPGAGPGPRDDSYAFAEGRMHGQYAEAARDQTGNDRAVLIVDLEPSYYGGSGNPQFWRDDLGAGPQQVRDYLNGALDGGAQEVWLSSVWRDNPQALRDVSIQSWLASNLVTEVHPQIYWTDMQKPWGAALDELDAAITALGLPDLMPAGRIRPTMPGTGTAADIIAFIERCRTRGFLRPSIWRRGTVPSAVWEAIGLRPEWEAPPVGTSLSSVRLDVLDARAAVDRAIQSLDRYQQQQHGG